MDDYKGFNGLPEYQKAVTVFALPHVGVAAFYCSA